MDQDDPTTAPTDPVEALLEQCLLRYPLEGSAALEAICRANPQYAAAVRADWRFLQRQRLLDSDLDDFVPRSIGEYHLLRRLGGGGMGVVYLAEQPSLARRVAVKLVRPELLFFAGSRARFQREVAAIAKLQHPGIVPVHATGEADGVPFLVMEWVAGASLAVLLKQLEGRRPDDLTAADLAAALAQTAPDVVVDQAAVIAAAPGPWWRVSTILVRQVAAAIVHAHGRGVLHRDIKPANVMVTGDGRVQLVDFGLARSTNDVAITTTGSPLGSLAYMAPEQVRGDADLDERTDVYGLGVLLYELLTLHSPFLDVDSETTRRRVLAGDCTAPRHRLRTVPRDLETICLRAMASLAAHRYQAVAELVADLDSALVHGPIRARRDGVWRRTTRFGRRRPALATLLVLLAVATPTIGTLWLGRLADREAVAAGERTRRAERISALLEEGWTEYRDRPDHARRAFEEVLRAEEDSALAVLGLCLVDWHRGEDDQVVARLARHGAVTTRHPMLLRLGDFASRPPDQFTLPADDVIPPTPIDWFVVGSIARLLAERGDQAAERRAAACFDQAIQLAATDELVFHLRRLDSLTELGDPVALRNAVQVVTTRWPQNVIALTTAAGALQTLDPPSALALLARAKALTPDAAIVWARAGLVFRHIGDLDAATTELRRAVELDPDRPECWKELADTRLLAHDLEQAEKTIGEAVRLAPHWPDALDSQGEILSAMGRTDEALAVWQHSIDVAPARGWPWFKRGRCRLRTGDPGAVDDLLAAAARLPQYAIVHGVLTQALRRAGRLAEAKQAAARAMQLAPEDAYWQLEYGFAQWRLGELDAAEATLAEVIGRLPDDTNAHAIRLGLSRERGDARTEAAEQQRWRDRGH